MRGAMPKPDITPVVPPIALSAPRLPALSLPIPSLPAETSAAPANSNATSNKVSPASAETLLPERNVQPYPPKVYLVSGADWQQDWEQKRRRLEKIALSKEADAPFRADFDMLESYYKTLVEDWREYKSKPPHQDLEGWRSNWRLNAIDYHLYSEPALLCGESDAAFYDLEDMRAIINDIRTAQEKRRAELKEWRLERIVGTPGVTPLKLGELEEERETEPEPTAEPKRDGTFCRITPGLGGYRHSAITLRPTKAIFYRYQPPEKGN